MKKNWMRHTVTAITLSAALFLAAPAQASGWTLWNPGSDFAQTAWQWISRLWSTWEGMDQPGHRSVGEKAGSGVDPSGSPAPSANPAPAQPSQTPGGAASDPNG